MGISSNSSGASDSAPSTNNPSASRWSPSANRSACSCARSRAASAQGVVGDQLSDGRHVDRGDLLGGQLGGRDELAERLDLIAPELQSRGTPGGTGEDVDDAAPNGELAAVLDHVGPRVAELDEPLGQVVGRELPAGHQLQRRDRAQRGDDALHRGERGRDQHERSPRGAEPVEGVGPSGRDLGRGRDLLVRQGFPRRQHGDAVVPEEGGDVVLERFGFPGSGRHGEHRRLERRGDAGDHEVLTRLGPREDRPGAFEQHPLERFGGDQVSEDLLQAHPMLPATPRTGLVAARRGLVQRGDSLMAPHTTRSRPRVSEPGPGRGTGPAWRRGRRPPGRGRRRPRYRPTR